MQSGKQKRAIIMARRTMRRARQDDAVLEPPKQPLGTVPVDRLCLAPCNSYGAPAFVGRGYYEDLAFTCRDCGARQVWTAEQQQWWYETAKGYVYSTAVRCLGCRRQRRQMQGGQLNKTMKAAA